MSTRNVPKFGYDSMSIKYLGVKATGRGPLPMKEFKVLAEQPMQEVRSITTPPNKRGKEVAGKTSVSGRIIFETAQSSRLSPKVSEELLATSPWNVTLHAYHPTEDAAYEARVLGIQLVEVGMAPIGAVCSFVASAVIQWKKV